MTGSCPVSASVCQETARERDELRAEVERLRSAVQSQHADLISLAESHERLWLGIESIRDEAWEPWLNKDWQHLDTVRNDCNDLLNPTEGDDRD